MFPDITVIIPTMNRVSILIGTLQRLVAGLAYSGSISYLIGNDGDHNLEKVLRAEGFSENQFRVLNHLERKGLGGNYNRLIAASETDIMLSTQDDYFLTRTLHLDEHVLKLTEDESAGWIRLRLTQGQDFNAIVKHRYWEVQWCSTGYYIASDQPHLMHRRFHDTYGLYDEGLRVGDTENNWCWRTKALGQENPEWPKVLIPVDWPCDNSWVHVGEGELSLKEQGY